MLSCVPDRKRGEEVNKEKDDLPAAGSSRSPCEEILEAMPWRCFHCDFITKDPAEAEAHFGERDDAEEFKPICKWWARMDDHERLEQLQLLIKDLDSERNDNYRQRIAIEGLEYQVGLLHGKEFSGYKPFRDAKVTSVHEVFCLYDSMEGRALAAEERLAQLQGTLASVPPQAETDVCAPQGEGE